MTISRRLFVVTGGSVGLLTLAACSSDPVQKAETPETDAGATTAPATTDTAAAASSGTTDLYDGSKVPPLGTEDLLNPDGLEDRPLGGKGAKVIMIEYSSPTCPHCATFANTVYPALKEKYIDTGKITFLFRPFVRNVLDSVVFLLAEAAGTEHYHEVVDTYFKTLETWAGSDTPRDEMEKIALQLGFTKESFEAALTNQDLFDGLNKVRDQALDKFGLTGTPTFFINGTKYEGEYGIDQLSAEIDPLLG